MAAVRMHSPPARTVKRTNQRWARQRPIVRGGTDHGDAVPLPPATEATAGIPGTFNGTPPADLAGMVGITAIPATPWTSGQFVQTQTAGAAGRATWTGSAWVGGAAPMSGGMSTPATSPASFNIAAIQGWVDENPDQADEVLAAEQARGDQARVTLVDWLQGFISHRDEGTLPEFMAQNP